MDIKEKYISALNIESAYRFAKKLETYKSNPKLGYRTAGSEAELLTGDMIYEHMKSMGLSEVTKDAFSPDAWEFKKAELYYTNRSGKVHRFIMGAYQTEFVTNGPEEFELVHVGRGTAADYEGLDVRGKLLLALDKTVIAPLDFSNLFRQAAKTIDCSLSHPADAKGLLELLNKAGKIAEQLYCRIETVNEQAVLGKEEKYAEYIKRAEAKLLYVFKKCQNKFVRLTWTDEVIFPHEASMNNIKHLTQAKLYLDEGKIREALLEIYKIDNNQYAFSFDEAVYRHFTDYVLNETKERLRWGWQRIIHHEDLYHLVKSLKEKAGNEKADLSEEILFLETALLRQQRLYKEDIEYMKMSVGDVCQILDEAKVLFEK